MARGNSLYAKLTRDLIPQYCKRIISDDETIQMLLSMLYQHTGIDYGNKTKAYSEGYETGRVETRRAYEGKRYTEAEMDKHGQLKYKEGSKDGYGEGFADGIKKRNDTIAVAENNGYQRGYAEGRKVEHDHAFSLGENAGYERRKKHVQVSEEHFYAKGHNEGYQKGKAEGVAIGIKVKDEALNEYRKDGYNEGLQEAEEKCAAQRQLRYQQGYDQGIKDSWNKLTGATGYTQGYEKGIEEGTKGKEKFANDRAEESYKKGHSQGIKDAWQKFDQGTTWEDGYQQGKRDADAKHQVLIAKAERQAHDAGFADGYGKGKQQGKKEVVDFINNMKVSQ